jgi:hypothetical protein
MEDGTKVNGKTEWLMDKGNTRSQIILILWVIGLITN